MRTCACSVRTWSVSRVYSWAFALNSLVARPRIDSVERPAHDELSSADVEYRGRDDAVQLGKVRLEGGKLVADDRSFLAQAPQSFDHHLDLAVQFCVGHEPERTTSPKGPRKSKSN